MNYDVLLKALTKKKGGGLSAELKPDSSGFIVNVLCTLADLNKCYPHHLFVDTRGLHQTTNKMCLSSLLNTHVDVKITTKSITLITWFNRTSKWQRIGKLPLIPFQILIWATQEDREWWLIYHQQQRSFCFWKETEMYHYEKEAYPKKVWGSF